MPKTAKVVAWSNLRWFSLLKSCLILTAVLAFSACSFTGSSSSSATLIPSGPTAAKAKTAPRTDASSVADARQETAQSAEITVQNFESINLSDGVAGVEEPATDEIVAASVAGAAQTGETAQTVEAVQPEAVSAEVMESALATIQKAESHLDLIDRNSCTAGLSGNLITGQAGQGFLKDHGLKSSFTLTADAISSPPSFEVAAAETPDPAPSAGTSEPSTTFILDTSKASISSTVKTGVTESLLMAAYEQTGRHYKSGGQNPETGFDSSGFTRWVYGQRGLSLPKDAAKQAGGGRQVAKEELRPGDLLVYRDSSGQAGGYHLGIYTGQGNFLHADAKNGVVTETAAFGPQYAPYFVSGRRYYDDANAAPLSDGQKMSATSSAVKLALSELGPGDTLKRPVAKKKPVKTAAAKTSSKKKK